LLIEKFDSGIPSAAIEAQKRKYHRNSGGFRKFFIQRRQIPAGVSGRALIKLFRMPWLLTYSLYADQRKVLGEQMAHIIFTVGSSEKACTLGATAGKNPFLSSLQIRRQI